MKDDVMCASILFTVFILLMIVFLFVIYGGKPEGLWWKVERYQAKNEKRLEYLEAMKINSDIKYEIQQEQIEIIRNQLAQIKPDGKE